ncbi:flagellar hook-length control protein FliK [Marinobacterium rhizophilum]|uniref:Flagellar hook-length control protein FliK n=1 Tax=Marinobacterium rhizophilum TaxID=420402 RepID=A0ABY5HCM1_9GAMM|nr:flagellar hook-length control protein FliK [Marinobacterium rhizophilum]UTW10030.1 flagellar hook-length control protein FliK [Marinobacterium rhizophilum]
MAFSDVLAGEAGGETLPQGPAPLPPGPGNGKGLPEAGMKPAPLAGPEGVTDTAVDSEGSALEGSVPVLQNTADTQAAPADTESRVGAINDAATAPVPGFPAASARAQARAAEESAVVSGLPAQATGAGRRQAVEGEVSTGRGPLAGAAQADLEANLDADLGGQRAAMPPSQLQSPAEPRVVPGSQTDASKVPSPGVATADTGAAVPSSQVRLPAEPRAIPGSQADAGKMPSPGVTTADAELPAQAPPPAMGIQALMTAIQHDAGQPLPAAVRQALEAQQRRLDAAALPQVAATRPALGSEAGAANLAAATAAVQQLPGVELSPGAASGLSREIPAELAAEQARVRVNTAEALARLASSAETAVDPGDDSVLQAAVLRTGSEGLRAGPGLGQLPAMPPGLSPGAAGVSPALSQGNAAWGQAISDRVLLMTAGNLQVAEIRLDPPELGTLHVRLQLNQDQASLSFTSPHAQVRDALEQQMPRLREMLAEQGLNLENSSVADDSRRRDRSAPEPGTDAGLMAEADDDLATPAPSMVSVSNALVDDYA